MAHLIKVNTPRSESENQALTRLASKLPASWIITTNIYEYRFSGPTKREIDSLLICPLGIFVLDFKNYAGAITPMLNRDWGGVNNIDKNPLEQGQNSIFPLKDLFRNYDDDLPHAVWLEWLIVLTHSDARLAWNTSDLSTDLRSRICLIEDVETNIHQLARGSFALGALTARKVLEALGQKSVAEDIFADWSHNERQSDSALSLLPSQASVGNQSHLKEESLRSQPESEWAREELVRAKSKALEVLPAVYECYHRSLSAIEELKAIRNLHKPPYPQDQRYFGSGLATLSAAEKTKVASITIRGWNNIEHASELLNSIRLPGDPLAQSESSMAPHEFPNVFVENERVQLAGLPDELRSMSRSLGYVRSGLARLSEPLFREGCRRIERQQAKLWFRNYAGGLKLLEQAAALGHQDAARCVELLRSWGVPKKNPRFSGDLPGSPKHYGGF
jgi:hypothetical protein